jgi:protease-4
MEMSMKKRVSKFAFGASAAAALAIASQSGAESNIGWIELEGGLSERPAGMALFAADSGLSLLDLVSSLEEVAGRDDLDGLVLRLREPQLTSSQIEEIGDTLLLLRSTGKQVAVFSEIYGPGELLLGSYADRIIMQTGGAVTAPAIYMEEMFLADALQWIGVEPSFIQIGDYKGAEEMYANSKPSDPWNENIDQLLDSLYDNARATMTMGRSLSESDLDKALASALFLDGEQAIELGLIDAEVDRLDLTSDLEDFFEDDDLVYNTNVTPPSASSTDFSNPFALLTALSEPTTNNPTDDTIAILHIDGAIVDGESSPGGAFSDGTVGAVTVRKALNELERDDFIKGVIIRINSPGGSAIASENIWQGVRRVASEKPVWVSVGSMAASGGYYIAVSGDRIYVNPSSIVGSIGVVAGKLALAGAYEKLHINVVPRGRGPLAGMLGGLNAWTPTEAALIRDSMQRTYDLFESRVTAGRPDIDIENAAEGRLFTAEKAIALGMADDIGGMQRVIYDLADELELPEGEYDVLHYPSPPSFEEMLEAAFGQFIQAPNTNLALDQAAGVLRALVGERSWPMVRASIGAMLQMQHEPIQLISPRVLIFR